MSSLKPWQQTLHPHMNHMFLRSLAACGLLWFGVAGWSRYHDFQVPAADPAKREMELTTIRSNLQTLDKAAQKLYSIEDMQRRLGDLDTSLIFFGRGDKAPDITLSYDKTAMEELRKKAENDAIDAARRAEYRIMLSPYLSGKEFADFATEYSKSRFGTAYMGALKDRDDEKYEPVPQLRACQKEVAAKNGTEYNFKNNEAVYECVSSSFNMRSVALYGGGAGILIMGMVVAGLRSEWTAAIERDKQQATTAAPPPPEHSPAPVTIVISTAQPVAINKPIRIRKSATP